MARGGISFEGIGVQQATFKAGESLKTLVEEHDRDYVIGMPVVVTGNGTVDLGSNGAAAFGIIDVYENDDHVGVTFRGFVEDVPIVKSSTTLNGIVAVNGSGKAKDLAPISVDTNTVDLKGAVRAPIFISVDTEAETATVFLG